MTIKFLLAHYNVNNTYDSHHSNMTKTVHCKKKLSIEFKDKSHYYLFYVYCI